MIFPEGWEEDYKLLLEKKIKQRELGEKYGVSQQTIHVWKKRYSAGDTEKTRTLRELYNLPILNNIRTVCRESLKTRDGKTVYYLFYDVKKSFVRLRTDANAFAGHENVLLCCKVTKPMNMKEISEAVYEALNANKPSN